MNCDHIALYILQCIGETGSSCYNFHGFKHNHGNEKSNTHNFFSIRQDEIPLLIKISESFEIQVNILKI